MAVPRRELADTAWAARLDMENLSGLIDHIMAEVIPLVRGEISRDVLAGLSGRTLDRLQLLERELDSEAK